MAFCFALPSRPSSMARSASFRFIGASVLAIEVIVQPLLKLAQVDVVDRAPTCEGERVRRRGSHADARSHHADCRERMRVRVHTPPGGDDVVRIRGSHAAERYVVDM